MPPRNDLPPKAVSIRQATPSDREALIDTLMQRHHPEYTECCRAPIVVMRERLMDEYEPTPGQHEHGCQRQRHNDSRIFILMQRSKQHDEQNIAHTECHEDSHRASHAFPEHADIGAYTRENEYRSEINK